VKKRVVVVVFSSSKLELLLEYNIMNKRQASAPAPDKV
jgi:hypothetical protein